LKQRIVGKLKTKIPKHCVKVSLNIKRIAGSLKTMTLELIVKLLHMERIVAGRSRVLMTKRCAELKQVIEIGYTYTID
jgi:hypothetical protein